ncbi:MAG TPA: hypothetical protein VKX16_02795 [Chloroflexota bacterium]|nr:hypothetical protein [Chloroflexota bacterium]
MDEAQVKILHMVADGTITPEQGGELLDLVDEEQPEPAPAAGFVRRSSPRRSAGQSGVSQEAIRRLTEASIHGVNAAFIRELGEHGISDLSLEELIELRVHGVSGTFIREMRELGFDHLTAKELAELSIHGINADFVREMVDLGFVDLTPDQLAELRTHGVNRAAHEAAGEPVTADAEER